ncbi:MAG TPA: MraY family glycosyltransferase [Bacteroidia bacterium]|jgi:UDP-GlcNAc:undecaprenyl-phosphate GlcNAc-1-phosphate transferase
MIHSDHYTVYLIFFAFALAFSWLINSLFLKFASTLGMRNKDETVIRWSKTSKPSLGGISFYILFLLSLASYPVVSGNTEQLLADRQLLGFLAATTMAFLMGLADDAYNTRPFLKFFVQLLCSVILISTGTSIHLFHNDAIDYPLTALWVVGIMNSINMLDNMDAITTVVSICIIGFGLYTQFLVNDFSNIYIFILFGVLGALMGFLYFNWHPSKMFMGDTGSQFLGIILASLGIVCFWNARDVQGHEVQSKQAISTALIFIIPVCDTASVVLNRVMNGRSPFVGGRDHTTHNLFYRGITERRIAVLFAGLTLLSGALDLLIFNITDWNYLHIALFSSWFVLVFGTLFYIVRKRSG